MHKIKITVPVQVQGILQTLGSNEPIFCITDDDLIERQLCAFINDLALALKFDLML